MNYYELIRSKRNEMFPPVLEVGTDVLIPQNGGEMYNYRVIDVLDSNSWLNIKKTWEGNKSHDEVERVALCRNYAIKDDVLERYNEKDIELIGKNISLNDILLMLDNKIRSTEVVPIHSPHIFLYTDGILVEEVITLCKLDLTKSIKDQTPKILKKLLELIK